MATTSDGGQFVWHEVSSKDVPSSEDFYSRLVGWKAEAWDQNPSYKLFLMRRAAKAGLWAIVEQLNQVTPPPHWLSYIGTAEVDATVRQVVELGGKVIVPAYNVPSIGRMAHLQDPQGALFAVSSQEDRSTYREPEPGDFSWHELLTTNWLTAWEFYSKVFGWEKMQTMDMGPQGIYQIFGAGGHQLGGMFTPGGLTGGPLWVPYILLRDARRSAELAVELGGTVVQGPTEVPGGDWVFTGLDRQGAMFGVHSRKRVAVSTADGKTTATRRAAPQKKSTRSQTRRKPAARKAARRRK